MKPQQLRLYHRLQIAAHRMKKAADLRLQQRVGISTAQAAVLTVVAEREAVSQRQLAETLDLNESGITAMVGRLTKLGLLQRRCSASDGRVRQLSLTPAGKEKLRESARELRHINRVIEGALAPEEQVALAGALERLGRAFDGD